MSDAVRVMIADDQVLVRTGFRRILTADGIEVVGEAADGAETAEVVRRTTPDAVLMDIRMPRRDGPESVPLAGRGRGVAAGLRSTVGQAEGWPVESCGAFRHGQRWRGRSLVRA